MTSNSPAPLSSSPTSFSWWNLGRDLWFSMLGGLLLTLLILIVPSLPFLWPLQILLGLTYVLYVPGYCLTAAFFPAHDDLDGIERTGLSLGLSVAWVPILALILDFLPRGLSLWPILGGQLLSIVLFCAIAFWRRRRLPTDMVFAPALDWRPRPWWQTLSTLEKRIYQLCAAALTIAGLSMAWVFLVPSPAEFMTEFYILGAEGRAESYPREAVPGEELSVTMGIHNMEREAATYTVEIWAIDPWDEREQLVNTAGPFSLAPGEKVEQSMTWEMPWVGQDQQVSFQLFIDEQSDPYRQLLLWMNVLDAP